MISRSVVLFGFTWLTSPLKKLTSMIGGACSEWSFTKKPSIVNYYFKIMQFEKQAAKIIVKVLVIMF